jgi:hypothetical protein
VDSFGRGYSGTTNLVDFNYYCEGNVYAVNNDTSTSYNRTTSSSLPTERKSYEYTSEHSTSNGWLLSLIGTSIGAAGTLHSASSSSSQFFSLHADQLAFTAGHLSTMNEPVKRNFSGRYQFDPRSCRERGRLPALSFS